MTKEFSTTLEEVGISNNSKSKINIFVCSIRKNAIAIIFCLFSICLVVFSTANLVAAKNGLILWATAVVPSLFPFFVATELLSHTNIISTFGKYFNIIMRPLFGVPGEASFAFLMGLISGYPVGAKIVSNLKENGICTKEEAERMLSFTNNSGPLFIIGTVGISLFGNVKIGILLFITHVISCITVGILLNIASFYKKKNINKTSKYFTNTNMLSKDNSLYKNVKSNSNNISFSSLGEILGKSITNATSTVLLIGGFVVIFSVIISILNESGIISIVSTIVSPILGIFNIPTSFASSIVSGFVELTNGVSLVANISGINLINIKVILCAFLLGFGGTSVLLQVFSIISKSGLSIKTYFIGKLLQGIIAAFYTFIALELFPIIL